MSSIAIPQDANVVLVKQAIISLSRGDVYARPTIDGQGRVTKGAETVVAASRLGWSAIEVRRRRQKMRPRRKGSEYTGPPVRPVWMTEDAYTVGELLRERLIEMLQPRDPERLKTGRALELAAAYLLTGDWGLPGEPVSAALRTELSLPGAQGPSNPAEAAEGPRRLSRRSRDVEEE